MLIDNMSDQMIVILYELIMAGVSIVIEKNGSKVIGRIYTPLKRAREAAVKKMADELGRSDHGFPSVNYLELNFRFDTPTARNEIQKVLGGELESIDENILKQEMVNELLQTRPDLKDKAGLIVDKFLEYFEQECLKSEELKGLALANIIRSESTATQKVVEEFGQDIKDQLAEIKSILTSNPATKATTNESDIIKVTSVLEKRLIAERDDLIAQIKKWQSDGLFEKVKELAKSAYKVLEHINPEVSGSIFRLCGSYILRSIEDHELAQYWIDLAHGSDPNNHKTIALRAELHLVKQEWEKAKLLLAPIADSSSEALVKIFYAETLLHLAGAADAFHWLKQHSDLDKDDSDVKLNLSIFAARCGEYDYAAGIIEKLKEDAHPGPYPFLISAEIHVQRSIPKDLITISSSEDLELAKNYEAYGAAIVDYERGLELLKLTAKSKSQKEIAHFANKLSAMYLNIKNTVLAEKTLCKHWNVIRKQSQSWFTAAAIAQQKTTNKFKVLARAQKVLKYSGEEHLEALFAYSLLCINMEEWDPCLAALNSTDSNALDAEHLKAKLQMTLICYFNKGDNEQAEKSISALKEQFPKDEMWLIHKSIMLAHQENDEAAIKLLEPERANFPDSINVKLRLAALYNKTENYALALPLYKELASGLRSTRAYEISCLVAFKLEIPDEVLNIANAAEQNQITTENLKHYKALALSMLHATDDAIHLFSSFDMSTLSTNDYLFYASCYANKSNLPKALTLLEDAKVKYPQDIRIRRTLYVTYLEVNQPEKAFDEAYFILQNNPDEKAAYFAVMTTGFAIGKGEIAHQAMMDYLSRFGEGPEFKRASIDELKEIQKIDMEQHEVLWSAYLKGTIPEIFLARNYRFGVGGHRIMLLETSQQVMAFNGHPDSQKDQLINASEGSNVLIDYQALITLYLLDLVNPALELFGHMFIPENVSNQISLDLVKLATSYQQDRRDIARRTFSIIQASFIIHENFPRIDINEIDESIGNLSFDLTTSKEANCSFVIPGYEKTDASAIKDSFDVELFTVLDLVDILKTQGLISFKQHEEAINVIEKYNITRHNNAISIPSKLMLDWQAAEMLEECNLLARLSAVAAKIHIGPFSYTLVRSEIDNYSLQERIHNTLIGLESLISKLVTANKVKIVSIPDRRRKLKIRITKKITETEYIEDLVNICDENKFVLWSDDLFTANYVYTAEKLKTIGTRTVLDVLVDRNIISNESFIDKIVQFLEWNMFFTWINTDIILSCAETYSYARSDAFIILIKALTNEISKIPDHSPDAIEKSNFDVPSIALIRLWLISDKSQQLAMSIFDDIHTVVKLKPKLNMFWVAKCIIEFAKIGELPLRDLLQKLSLRFTGHIRDEFKSILKVILKICATDKESLIIQIGNRRIVAANILKAVRVGIPGYYDEMKGYAFKLDPTLSAFI